MKTVNRKRSTPIHQGGRKKERRERERGVTNDRLVTSLFSSTYT